MYCFCVFSPKIVAHLSAPAPDKPSGPVALSQNSFVRFSFKEGGEKDVSRCVKPNTHRRRRRDETVESRRVGGVYTNSQLVGNSFVVSSV